MRLHHLLKPLQLGCGQGRRAHHANHVDMVFRAINPAVGASYVGHHVGAAVAVQKFEKICIDSVVRRCSRCRCQQKTLVGGGNIGVGYCLLQSLLPGKTFREGCHEPVKALVGSLFESELIERFCVAAGYQSFVHRVYALVLFLHLVKQ